MRASVPCAVFGLCGFLRCRGLFRDGFLRCRGLFRGGFLRCRGLFGGFFRCRELFRGGFFRCRGFLRCLGFLAVGSSFAVGRPVPFGRQVAAVGRCAALGLHLSSACDADRKDDDLRTRHAGERDHQPGERDLLFADRPCERDGIGRAVAPRVICRILQRDGNGIFARFGGGSARHFHDRRVESDGQVDDLAAVRRILLRRRGRLFDEALFDRPGERDARSAARPCVVGGIFEGYCDGITARVRRFQRDLAAVHADGDVGGERHGDVIESRERVRLLAAAVRCRRIFQRGRRKHGFCDRERYRFRLRRRIISGRADIRPHPVRSGIRRHRRRVGAVLGRSVHIDDTLRTEERQRTRRRVRLTAATPARKGRLRREGVLRLRDGEGHGDGCAVRFRPAGIRGVFEREHDRVTPRVHHVFGLRDGIATCFGNAGNKRRARIGFTRRGRLLHRHAVDDERRARIARERIVAVGDARRDNIAARKRGDFRAADGNAAVRSARIGERDGDFVPLRNAAERRCRRRDRSAVHAAARRDLHGDPARRDRVNAVDERDGIISVGRGAADDIRTRVVALRLDERDAEAALLVARHKPARHELRLIERDLFAVRRPLIADRHDRGRGRHGQRTGGIFDDVIFRSIPRRGDRIPAGIRSDGIAVRERELSAEHGRAVAVHKARVAHPERFGRLLAVHDAVAADADGERRLFDGESDVGIRFVVVAALVGDISADNVHACVLRHFIRPVRELTEIVAHALVVDRVRVDHRAVLRRRRRRGGRFAVSERRGEIELRDLVILCGCDRPGERDARSFLLPRIIAAVFEGDGDRIRPCVRRHERDAAAVYADGDTGGERHGDVVESRERVRLFAAGKHGLSVRKHGRGEHRFSDRQGDCRRLRRRIIVGGGDECLHIVGTRIRGNGSFVVAVFGRRIHIHDGLRSELRLPALRRICAPAVDPALNGRVFRERVLRLRDGIGAVLERDRIIRCRRRAGYGIRTRIFALRLGKHNAEDILFISRHEPARLEL